MARRGILVLLALVVLFMLGAIAAEGSHRFVDVPRISNVP
jgi:hypothetical protein